MHPVPRTLVLAAALAVALAGCGETDDAADVAADATDPAPDDAPDDTADAADDTADEPGDDPEAAGEPTVATADTDLGEVLVDGAGMTLYLFEPDDQGESTCYDACADNWPPLVVEDAPVAGDGVDGQLVGTTPRDDGSTQVTYDGWPLYLWAGDQQPGEASGQGVQDVWWVVAPDGEPVRDAQEEPAGTAESPGY